MNKESRSRRFPYEFLENVEEREVYFVPKFMPKIRWFIIGQIKPFFLRIHKNYNDNRLLRGLLAERLFEVIISAIQKTHGKIDSTFLSEEVSYPEKR